MEAHNDSGYTIRAFNFEPQNLVYSMDRATVSLEDYIENNTLEDSEKDAINLVIENEKISQKFHHISQIFHQ